MVAVLTLVGALSTYWPNDGFNGGALACGGTLTWKSHHVAIRGGARWCGYPVRVCVGHRCVMTKVMDAGPFGCVNAEGEWRNCVRGRPRGFRYRGVVDLTYAVWRDLGQPPFLTKATVTVYRRTVKPEQTRTPLVLVLEWGKEILAQAEVVAR